MAQDCIFCKIVASEIPAVKVYEDEQALAFLDIKPVNKGHVLVIPKVHYATMIDAPAETVSQLFVKSQALMKAIKIAVSADFVVVSVVGVEVPHFHIHLIPRFHSDGLPLMWPTKEYGDGEMEQYVQKIKNAL